MTGRIIGRDDERDAAVSALDDTDGVLLTGESGVGKTHLLAEVRRIAQSSGVHIADLRTSPATSEIPLWPFVHLLPETAPSGIQNLAYEIRAHLPTASSRGVVLVVDDAHLLDRASVGMLEHLLDDDGFSVLAAVRDGEPVSPWLDDVWRRFDITRVAVEPFSADHSAAMIDEMLAGPCNESVVTTLSDVARGNPLLLRELLLDGIEQGALERHGGVWRLADGFEDAFAVVGDRTLRCVVRRIERLTADERHVLHLVAVAGSMRMGLIPLDLVDSVNVLDARHLLAISSGDSGRWQIGFDHPVVGDAVLRTMPAATRRRVVRELMQLVRATEDLLPGDHVRLAIWAEDADEALDVTEWLAATHEAFGTFNLDAAERWARRALRVDPDSHTSYRALGRILRHHGDLEGAEEAFAEADRCASGDEQIAMAAIDRSGLVGLQGRDPRQAIDVLMRAAERVCDPARALALRSEAAVLATLGGRFEDVLLAQPTEEQMASADDLTRWQLGLNQAYARAMLGQLTDIDAIVDSTLRYYPAVSGERPQERDFVLGLRGVANLERGRLTSGIDELARLVAEHRQAGAYRGIMTLALTLMMQLASDPRAGEVADDGIAQHNWLDPLSTKPIAIAAAALAAAEIGDIDRAEDLVTGATSGSEPWTSIWIGRAAARVAFHRGDRQRAVDRAATAGEAALDTSHFAHAAVVFHDLVLYGEPARAAEYLDAAVTPTVGCDLLELFLRHAGAAATANVESLGQCADEFARMGATRLSATANFQRAEAAVAQGDLARARRAEAAGRLTVADVAPFVVPDPPDVPDHLTDREREIAVMAASGSTSKTVAETLELSVRTVDNHLRRVYRKLDIGGRDELATCLPAIHS